MASLRLRVTNGPSKGKTFSLRPGLKIGRSKGDIIVPDAKISILHAYIKAQGKDLILHDNGSKNGIFAYGQKLTQIALKIDTVFTLGLTTFLVEPDEIEIDEVSKKTVGSLHMDPTFAKQSVLSKAQASVSRTVAPVEDDLGELDFTKYSERATKNVPKEEAPPSRTNEKLETSAPSEVSPSVFKAPPEEPTQMSPQQKPALPPHENQKAPAVTVAAPTPTSPLEPEQSISTSEVKAPVEEMTVEPVVPEEPKARHWTEFLVEFSHEVLSATKDQPRAIVALNPAVWFTFIGGPQAETQWVLGYGPRRIGSTSVELPIFEPGAPDVCFEILPAPEGVTFRTNHPKDVNLNGKSVKLQSLKAGDCITIGKTRIEVDVIK